MAAQLHACMVACMHACVARLHGCAGRMGARLQCVLTRLLAMQLYQLHVIGSPRIFGRAKVAHKQLQGLCGCVCESQLERCP